MGNDIYTYNYSMDEIFYVTFSQTGSQQHSNDVVAAQQANIKLLDPLVQLSNSN